MDRRGPGDPEAEYTGRENRPTASRSGEGATIGEQILIRTSGCSWWDTVPYQRRSAGLVRNRFRRAVPLGL